VTVRVATVLSARTWEPMLVAHATETAAVRVALRAFQPRDIESRSDDIDVVVAGGEVAWVTPHQISMWRRLGLGVIGIHPPGDRPAAALLELGGADEVLPDDVDIAALVQAIRFVAPSERRTPTGSRGSVAAVVGTRGAPGCTEVACAYALALSRQSSVVLVDADVTAPSLAVRLGVAPRPDIADAADSVRSEGLIERSALREVGSLDVITGSHRDEEEPVGDQMLSGLVEAAATQYEHVVLDMGSDSPSHGLLECLDEMLLVVEASPVGIVRAAQATRSWFGPTPRVIVNKCHHRSRDEVVRAVRTWTGLDPVAVIPRRARVRRYASAGRLPDLRFERAVGSIGAPS